MDDYDEKLSMEYFEITLSLTHPLASKFIQASKDFADTRITIICHSDDATGIENYKTAYRLNDERVIKLRDTSKTMQNCFVLCRCVVVGIIKYFVYENHFSYI